MPTYSYLCHSCGAFDRLRPMSESAHETPCPTCATQARRVFGAPALATVHRGLHRAADAAAASAEAPTVVRSTPSAMGAGSLGSGRRGGGRYPALPRP